MSFHKTNLCECAIACVQVYAFPLFPLFPPLQDETPRMCDRMCSEWYNSSTYPAGCSGSPVGGPTEEDPHCLDDMGLTGDIAFTNAMTDAWCAVRHRLFEAVRLAGGWFWQMFSLQSTPVQAQCATTLRSMCAAGASSPFYNATTMHSMTGNHTTLPNFAQDLATFMLLRGPYAWLGFGWSGCNVVNTFPPELLLDYGEPTGFCSETAPNSSIFTRDWTKATVTVRARARHCMR